MLNSAPPPFTNAPVRPKIGRPPAPSLSVVTSEDTSASSVSATPHFIRRATWVAVLLIGIGLTAVILLALPPRSTGIPLNDEPPMPSLKSETFTIKTPEGSLTGRLEKIDAGDTDSVGNTAAPATKGAIDNADRQRLLSILSKD